MIETVFMIVGIIIGWGCLAGGIYLLIKKTTHSGSTFATVTSVDCKRDDEKYIDLTCKMDLNYKIDNKIYNITQEGLGFKPETGYQIPIQYNPNQPTDVIVSDLSYRGAGGFLIGLGVFITIVGVLAWIVQKQSAFSKKDVGLFKNLFTL